MSLVGHHDDVATIRQHRIGLALLGSELLDQRKDKPVVFSKQLLQMVAAFGLAIFSHDTGVGEVLVDLQIQIGSVSDDYKSPIARNLSQDLL